MPDDDVSDLRDVVDAINKLCETMKTSYDEDDCDDENPESVDPNVLSNNVETYVAVTSVATSSNVVNVAEQSVATAANVVYVAEQSVATAANMVYVAEQSVATASNVYVAEKSVATASEPIVYELTPQEIKNTLRVNNTQPVVFASETLQNMDRHKPVVEPVESAPQPAEMFTAKTWSDKLDIESDASASKTVTTKTVPIVNDIEIALRTIITERWNDRVEEMESIVSDSEQIAESVPCEPMSEMYYTASSEISLLSDIDSQDKAQSEESDKEKDDRDSVMAGHVAAMRERFESMTRTNTPCPDLIRSASPSFELFRNLSASPDNLE